MNSERVRGRGRMVCGLRRAGYALSRSQLPTRGWEKVDLEGFQASFLGTCLAHDLIKF